MTYRILLSDGRVAISRPGHDVLYSISSFETMAFDTNLPEIDRPLKAGTIHSASVNDRPFVYYDTTYTSRPAVIAMPTTGNAIIHEPFLVTSVNIGNERRDVWHTSFAIDHYHHGFQIVPADSWPAGWRDAKYNWIYAAFATA